MCKHAIIVLLLFRSALKITKQLNKITMSQKHSCVKSTQFVPKALTSDKMIGRAGAEDAGTHHHDVVGSVHVSVSSPESDRFPLVASKP